MKAAKNINFDGKLKRNLKYLLGRVRTNGIKSLVLVRTKRCYFYGQC